MSHICLGAVEQSLELQSIRVSIGNHVSNLADDRCEYEDADQVADYRKDVPTDQEARKRADQSKEDVISVLGSWTSGPRRSLSPLSLSLSFFSLYFLPYLLSFVPPYLPLSFFLPFFRSSLSILPLTFSLIQRLCHFLYSFAHTLIRKFTYTRHVTFHAQKNVRDSKRSQCVFYDSSDLNFSRLSFVWFEFGYALSEPINANNLSRRRRGLNSLSHEIFMRNFWRIGNCDSFVFLWLLRMHLRKKQICQW